MRRFILTLVVSFGLGGIDLQAGEKSRLPNVVFILADDLGWADLGCTGSTFYETPHLDRLAKGGMRFTNGYASCPVCSPTRAAILTGKHPARLGTTDWFGGGARKGKLLPAPYLDYLPVDETTLAQVLRAAGYVSAMIGKWHLGGEGFDPLKYGFDVNIAGNRRGSPPSYFSPYKNPNLPDGPQGEQLTDRLTTEALKFIEKNRDRPFFAYVAYHAVHTPLQAKKDLVQKYRTKAAARDTIDPFTKLDGVKVRQVQDHAVYAAMLETLDVNVGRILDLLEKLGLAENTIVVFTSDNGGLSTSEGWPTSNLPLRVGKGWLYEGGTRVPLLLRWPGRIPAGRTSHVPAVSTDFFPTILDAAGLPLRPRQHLDGVSLLPVLTGKGILPPRDLLWHYPHYSNQGGRPGGSIRRGDLVLIEHYEDGKLELFDLAKDLGQKNDIASGHPREVADMRQALHRWRREVGAKMPTPNPNWKK